MAILGHSLRRFLWAVAFAGLAFGGPQAWSATWHWSVVVRGGREPAGPSRAFLWIPPDCSRVKGVVLAQHNMEEISILENPGFRRGMADLGFAEVWCCPAFDHLFRFNEGAGGTFDGMMSDLANESGYQELAYVPVVTMGHSAAASWPYYFAAWNPERTLASLSVSGQWPYWRDNGTFAPDVWGDRNIDTVPCLETMGEYESANTWSTEGLKERREHPLMPLSMLACPAEGHFAATNKKVEYLVLYIKKAVQYRMPMDWDGRSPARLIPIDPTKTGWLADRWRINQPPTAPAAGVGRYAGDPNQAFWFFDEEIAKATEAYQATYRGMKAQLVGYVQDTAVKTLKLRATCDSGSPVYYYVREGPAEVDGDILRLTAVPARAKFPVKVTVVAWQYGRSAEPKLKTADPVERTFSVVGRP